MVGRVIKSIAPILLVVSTVLWAEPSVYASESYDTYEEDTGYTPQQNNTPLQQPTLASLNRQIQVQNERIDGLTTLVEGLSASLFELQQKVAANGGGTENSQQLSVMVEKINNSYVSRAELQQALAGNKVAPVSSPPRAVAINNQTVAASQSEVSLESKPNETLYNEGVRMFGKREYDEAMKRFSIVDKKGHKPAASNYYLGEISYYTGKYEDAIFYYKKSAGLYDKAEYMDVLLLHTAISLEKTGNKDQAKLFYQNIIDNYGNKKTAQLARDMIKKL